MRSSCHHVLNTLAVSLLIFFGSKRGNCSSEVRKIVLWFPLRELCKKSIAVHASQSSGLLGSEVTPGLSHSVPVGHSACEGEARRQGCISPTLRGLFKKPHSQKGLAEVFQKRRQGQRPFPNHSNSINYKQKVAPFSLSVHLYFYKYIKSNFPALRPWEGCYNGIIQSTGL